MTTRATTLSKASTVAGGSRTTPRAWLAAENARGANYPLSRWWLRPVATWMAANLAYTPVRPWHVTLVGLLLAAAAASVVAIDSAGSLTAAALIMLAWLCDRTDGPLARRLCQASPRGAWLDANIDELVDLGLHVAITFAAANQRQSNLPWGLLAAFLMGKYLFMYGLNLEREVSPHRPAMPAATASNGAPLGTSSGTSLGRMARALYHAPANADIRIHLLALAVACNWLMAGLACVAVYYNLRWIARYVLVCRRLPETST